MMRRAGNGISDGRLDRALRTLIAREDAPVDVRARVMAAIDAPVSSQARPRWRVAAAAALCCAAVLLAAGLAIWSGAPDVVPGRVAQGVGTGAAKGRDAAGRAALPPPNETHTVQTASAEHSRSRGAIRRVRTSGSRAADQSGAGWDAALPPLDPPDFLAVEQIDAPPVQVVRLSIEHLSIDPLEVDPLDRSREE
jgi:hypothetical protein